MSDRAFTRLMIVLLLLICGCLMLLDQQRQRELWSVRREIDNAHARMNAAGLLDRISTSLWPWNAASPIEAALTAPSNDALNHLAKGNT